MATYDPEVLWSRYTITHEDNRQFIDSKILEDMSGTVISNKFRKLSTMVEDILSGTAINLNDVVRRIARPRQRSHSVVIAVSNKQIILTISINAFIIHSIRCFTS